MEYSLTGARARWSVMWVAKKKGKKPRIVEITFQDDLSAALELYVKVIEAKKPFATLRSCNVGFPPPEKYRPHTKTVVVNRKVRGRIKKVKEERDVEPMRTLNLKGIWWCPYCIRMRRVQNQDGFVLDGRYVNKSGIHCPICGTSHRDHHMRKWNPQAQMVEFRQIRRSNGRSTRRRRS